MIEDAFSDTLTSAGPLGRCWNPRLSGLVFNTSLGGPADVNAQKIMFDPYIEIVHSDTNFHCEKTSNLVELKPNICYVFYIVQWFWVLFKWRAAYGNCVLTLINLSFHRLADLWNDRFSILWQIICHFVDILDLFVPKAFLLWLGKSQMCTCTK